MGFPLAAVSRGYSQVAASMLLVSGASLIAEHRPREWTSVVTAPRIQSTGSTGVVHGLS